MGERLERQGVLSFTVEQALEALEYAMQLRLKQVSVLRMNWNVWRGLGVTTRVSPRFAHLIRQESNVAAAGQRIQVTPDRIRALPPQERGSLVRDAIVSKVAHLLGAPDGQLELEVPLVELGLDSLMAVELRNWLEGSLEASLSISALMRGGTVDSLTNDVVAIYSQSSSQESDNGESAPALSAEHAESLLAQIDHLSEEEVHSW